MTSGPRNGHARHTGQSMDAMPDGRARTVLTCVDARRADRMMSDRWTTAGRLAGPARGARSGTFRAALEAGGRISPG